MSINIRKKELPSLKLTGFGGRETIEKYLEIRLVVNGVPPMES